MKIGVRSVCVSRDFGEALSICSEAGLDGIQVAVPEGNLLEATDEELLAFKAHVEASGLEIASSSAGPKLANPAVSDDSVAKFARILHAAAVVGHRIVTGEVKNLPEGVSPEVGWETCIANVRKVCEHAESEGVCFGVEPGPYCLVSTTEDVERLLSEVGSDSLRVNYDGGNLWAGGSDATDAVKRLGPKTVHVHVKDYSRALGKETALGDGDVDYATVIRELRAVGYDGWLVIERERTEDPEADLRKAVSRLREILSAP